MQVVLHLLNHLFFPVEEFIKKKSRQIVQRFCIGNTELNVNHFFQECS